MPVDGTQQGERMRRIGVLTGRPAPQPGHTDTAPPSSVMNSRRRMPDTGLPAPTVCFRHAQPATERPDESYGQT